MAEALFESNWSATKEALLEGLQGSKKSTMDVILENAKFNYKNQQLQVLQ